MSRRTFSLSEAMLWGAHDLREDGELYESIGGAVEQTPFDTRIPADSRGETAAPGVWAAGNAGQPMAMVISSSASGVTTGSAVHGDLLLADLDRAVRARTGDPAHAAEGIPVSAPTLALGRGAGR